MTSVAVADRPTFRHPAVALALEASEKRERARKEAMPEGDAVLFILITTSIECEAVGEISPCSPSRRQMLDLSPKQLLQMVNTCNDGHVTLQEVQSTGGPEANVVELDADGDGLVTAEEAEAAAGSSCNLEQAFSSGGSLGTPAEQSTEDINLSSEVVDPHSTLSNIIIRP